VTYENFRSQFHKAVEVLQVVSKIVVFIDSILPDSL